MADMPPEYIGVHVSCSFERSARRAVTHVTDGHVLVSAYDGKGVLVSDSDGCAIGYLTDDCADEVASWMRRGWFFHTTCAMVQPCIYHWAHLFVNLRPIKPRTVATKKQTKITKKETVDA